MMDKYFSTNALHGSVYDIEDLLSVTMVNEKLEVFMRNWDTVLSGIKMLPEESFLEPIFHRQIKKARVLQHDLNIYERTLEGTPERTYRFLYDAAFRYIDRKRTDRNRERIYQSVGGRPSPGAPAPPSKKYVPKGFAMARVRRTVASTNMRSLKREDGRDPKVDHLARLLVRTVQARAPISPGCAAFTSKADVTRGAGASSSTLRNPAQLRRQVQGVASPGVKGEARAVGARRMVPDDPVPSSRTSKSSSQGSKGSGSKRNSNKPRVPAAACLLGALIAASSSTPADAASFAFRKEVPDIADHCYLASHVALPVVRFNDTPDYVNVPLRGEARQVHSPSRKYERQFPITKPPKRTFRTSRTPSLQLNC